MNKELKHSLLEFLDDLSDIQISRLVYRCLDCKIEEIAKRRRVSRTAINNTISLIKTRREHQEFMTALQEALSKGGFLLH